jgi:hypothetical protein
LRNVTDPQVNGFSQQESINFSPNLGQMLLKASFILSEGRKGEKN